MLQTRGRSLMYHLLNTKSSSTDDDPSFNLTLARVLNSRQIFTQHPNLMSSPSSIVEDVCDGQNNLRLDRLFAGYCVVGLNENRTLLALGGRWGTVAVFRFTDSGNLDCLTVFDLPTRNKVMSLSWLNDHPEHYSGSALLVGVFPQETVSLAIPFPHLLI
ncbi:unnamed protein product [Dibothriocephalus latus]|uniref:Uncharacterized protein n=1 Tax=Dibothriocephalus latus TaxID=60516 RepID=A0A3P7L3R3_DIBLA|nr:unnamed protein product [Dibothriocephalus latus]